MAKCRQLLILLSLWPGTIVCCFFISILIITFSTLLLHVPKIIWKEFINDAYLWYVIFFTFLQAFLSTLLSVIPAIFIAKSLFRRYFPCRTLFLHLCSIIFALPVLVAIFGLLTIYGRMGWIAKLCQWLGINYQFTPYGLKGILLAHIFFNLPLSIHMLLQTLENIPIEQRQLAAQLGMNHWQYLRIVEWPYIRRQILPIFSLIFMLCFSSFSTALTLGGGPAATTIELAIYQSLSYDFNINKAAFLSLLQLFFCLSLILFSQKFNVVFSVGNTQKFYWMNTYDNIIKKIWDTFLISFTIFFLITPLLAIIIDGVNFTALHSLKNPGLWKAFANSIYISINAGVLCIILTMMILWSTRELRLRNFIKLYKIMTMSGLLILAIPSIVLTTSFFLLFHNTFEFNYSPYGLIIFTNALMSIPYALKVLENPMYDLGERYNILCISLNIKNINRLCIIELKALKYTIRKAFAFSCILSIGDFGIIALFGNENFHTLPHYLYEQLAAYLNKDAAGTALVLLFLCFSISILSQNWSGKRKYD
ncbi:thiamine/thiamine pyrophosphate ABC transporter permease ThiP [Arsenophonus symbiont of Ornithomya chloropus]|uniref:thiamine/thiamine pyrophosphate ABC transporter permease ThiP n=1 Tax=Arsenophonus symbiont of Ornithomya chloropus TaxID=634121 RepID=UPI0032B0FBE0